MKRALKVLSTVLFLGFCWYAFQTIDGSDGVKYRQRIEKLEDDLVEANKDRKEALEVRDSAEAERDGLQKQIKQAISGAQDSEDSSEADVTDETGE